MLLLTQVCKACTSSRVYAPACWRPVCREAVCFDGVDLGELGADGSGEIERGWGWSSVVELHFFARFAGGLRRGFDLAWACKVVNAGLLPRSGNLGVAASDIPWFSSHHWVLGRWFQFSQLLRRRPCPAPPLWGKPR